MRWKTRLGIVGFLVFTAIPILEIALLIEIGRRIGTFSTVCLVIGTALLGGTLLTAEGYGVIRRAKEEISLGHIPEDEIIDGVLVVIGALLLITPGVITDVTGVVLMLSPTRSLFRTAIKRWIRKFILINY